MKPFNSIKDLNNMKPTRIMKNPFNNFKWLLES